MVRISLAIVALAACSSRHHDPHWSTRALVMTEGKTGIEHVAFTIRVPEGYSTLELPSFEYMRGDGVEPYLQLEILDGAKRAPADVLAKLGGSLQAFAQRDQPDGWAFAVRDPSSRKTSDYVVYAAKFAGDRELECVAHASALDDEDVRALCPKIEDICLSVAPKT